MSDEDDTTLDLLGLSRPDSVDSLIAAVAAAPPQSIDGLLEPTLRDLHGADVIATLRHPLTHVPETGSIVDGRYILEQVLGSGGMGVVYAARNLHTRKQVALKYLVLPRHPRAHSEQRAARLLREARAAGCVRHLNVVDMIDVGGDPRQPYLVMELLHGESLWARMQRGRLPPGEALPIVIGAMRGLAEAHKQGVIHRDLKPENIFLAKTPEHGLVPKVLDFGVSRLTPGEGERRTTTLTHTGFIVGTPSYMPLEQLRGKADVDGRADIYALGVLLYEALSGRRPFEATNDHDLGIKMATERPTPLSKLLPDVPPALERAVMRAIAREPEARHPSVEAFIAALEQAPHERWYRRAQPWLLGGVLGTLVLAIVWFARTLLVPPPTPVVAQSTPPLVPAITSSAAAAPTPASVPPTTFPPLPPVAPVTAVPAPPTEDTKAPSPSPPLARAPRARIAPIPGEPMPTPQPLQPVKRATELLPQDF